MNAFFRWEFNSCETIVKDGEGAPIDYANASPDVAIVAPLLLPVGDAGARAHGHRSPSSPAGRCGSTSIPREYFAIGDRDDLSYDEKLRVYRLADEYFETARYEEFVDEALGRLDELTVGYFESPAFDDLLVQTVRSTFPEHEHEHFVEHYRGLVGAWAGDQGAT